MRFLPGWMYFGRWLIVVFLVYVFWSQVFVMLIVAKLPIRDNFDGSDFDTWVRISLYYPGSHVVYLFTAMLFCLDVVLKRRSYRKQEGGL